MKKLAVVIALLLILTICFCACSGEQLAMDLADKVAQKEGLHPNKATDEDEQEEQAGGETEGDGEQGGEDEGEYIEYPIKTIDDRTSYDEVTPSLTEEQYNAAFDYNTNFREFVMHQVSTIQAPGLDTTMDRTAGKKKYVFNENAFMVYVEDENGVLQPNEYILIKDGFIYTFGIGFDDETLEEIWVNESEPTETEETNIMRFIPTSIGLMIDPDCRRPYTDFRYNASADLYSTNKYDHSHGSATIVFHLSFKESKLVWAEEINATIAQDSNGVNEIMYFEEEYNIQYGHEDIVIPDELAALLPA